MVSRRRLRLAAGVASWVGWLGVVAMVGGCELPADADPSPAPGPDAAADARDAGAPSPTGPGAGRTGGQPSTGGGRDQYGPDWADELVAAPGDTGEGLFDAAKAVNGVRGAVSAGLGGADTFSLGLTPEAGALVVRWSGRRVIDVPGPDLAVFENPFLIGAGPRRFMDQVIVEVSRDGVTWVAFPHAFTAADPSRYSNDPADWRGFAGVTPVRLHEEANPVDPFDAEAAGGDAFDLAALATLPADSPGHAEGAAIAAEGARFVRLVAAPTRVNPDTGAPYPRDLASNGPDIDGIYAQVLVDDAAP